MHLFWLNRRIHVNLRRTERLAFSSRLYKIIHCSDVAYQLIRAKFYLQAIGCDGF